jgi:hypothetical protein
VPSVCVLSGQTSPDLLSIVVRERKEGEDLVKALVDVGRQLTSHGLDLSHFMLADILEDPLNFAVRGALPVRQVLPQQDK